MLTPTRSPSPALPPQQVSYFNNYQGKGVANAPYVLSFSTGTVYNVGTQYLIGNMMTATENCNEFTVPVTGGAGPCPNGAMRSGSLTITCGADQTSFAVDENPMCSYAMSYVTSQACPPGTQVCGAAQTATITAAAVAAATPAASASCTRMDALMRRSMVACRYLSASWRRRASPLVCLALRTRARISAARLEYTTAAGTSSCSKAKVPDRAIAPMRFQRFAVGTLGAEDTA